jgi:ribosome maturation factor RimP
MTSFDEYVPLIRSTAEGLGFELFDARFFGSGPRSVLRVTIDKPGGVSVSDCERVSGAVGKLLDEEDFFGGKPYTLEVSSPGIDRPLKEERDYRRIIGRDVAVHLAEAVNGKKSLRGKVLGCEGGVLNIEIGGEPTQIPLASILSGKEEVKFK